MRKVILWAIALGVVIAIGLYAGIKSHDKGSCYDPTVSSKHVC